MRSFLAALLVAASALSASANPATNMTRVPSAGSLVVDVQSRSCRACRNGCSIDRRYCGYSQSCRRAFTLCMRACWEDVCR